MPNVVSVEGVLEHVAVVSAGDLDAEAAGESGELAGAGVGHHDDVEGALAASHRRVVLEDECASLAMQGSGHALDGYVARKRKETSIKPPMNQLVLTKKMIPTTIRSDPK